MFFWPEKFRNMNYFFNFKDYFISVSQALWWISKQTINNADYFFAGIWSLYPGECILYSISVLKYWITHCRQLSFIRKMKNVPYSQGCSLYTANTMNTLKYGVLEIQAHGFYGFIPYLTVTSYNPSCADQMVNWLVLIIGTQCVLRLVQSDTNVR
jgi:hypothetical protein